MPHSTTTIRGDLVSLLDDFESVPVSTLDEEERLELLKRVDAHLVD